MNLTPLITTTAGGIALIAAALLLRRKRPQWVGTHALLMLGGGIAAIQLIALILGIVIGWGQDLLNWSAKHAATWGQVGAVLHAILGGIAAALPWAVGIVLTVWLLIDLFPRVGQLRSGRLDGGGPGGLSVHHNRNGSIASRIAGLHSAESHTMWVAVLVPAAFALVPPLTHLLRIGV